MLPDFPAVKKHVREAHIRIMTTAMNAARGVFSEIRARPIKEGRETSIVRPSGKRDDTKMHKLTVSETIPVDAVEAWTDEQVVAHYQKLGAEMGRKQARATYEELDKVTEATGNVVNADGPLTPDVFFAAIEKVTIEFGVDGKPRLPTMVIHPKQTEAWQKVGELMQTDAANDKRFRELMERKRLEWIERESSRKLVG